MGERFINMNDVINEVVLFEGSGGNSGRSGGGRNRGRGNRGLVSISVSGNSPGARIARQRAVARLRRR